MNDAPVFALIREMLNRGITPDEFSKLKTALENLNTSTVAVIKPAPLVTEFLQGMITEKIALELMNHEALIREMYLDSKRIPTWSVGITSASGHGVERYKDNPQTIAKCIAVYLWLCKTKYGPEVQKAFAGHTLTEAQFCAALSFHYNTGAIARASWVISWKAGNRDQAYKEFMNWVSPPEIKERREKERDLFFKDAWTQDGKCTIYEVSKPSYSPKWSSAKRVDIRNELRAALAEV